VRGRPPECADPSQAVGDVIVAGGPLTGVRGLADVAGLIPPVTIQFLDDERKWQRVNCSRSSSPAGSALAQKRIRKLQGFNACSLGHGDDQKQHFHSPIDYEVMPIYGNVCASGWMSIGSGCCKKETLGSV
jgi:hypothetical protein